MRLRAFPGAGVLVKTISGKRRRVRHIASAAHVPFAKMTRGISGCPQRSRERRRGWIEKVRLLTFTIARARLQVARDLPPRRKHAGDDASARRRTNWRGAVILSKPNSFFCQAVNVRRRR